MRRTTLVTLTMTLLFTVGAVGQQEQLFVDLRVEPARAERAESLYEAASRNDFYTFDALYRREPVAEYAELHRLWTWAMADPIGAFYGTEGHDRLARIYPGYAGYIEQYRIVDSNGNLFYPTAETRRFLVSQAVTGLVPRGVERVRVAAAPAPVESAPVRTPAPQSSPETAPVAQSVRESVPVRPPAAQSTPEIAPVTVDVPAEIPLAVASRVVSPPESEPVRGVVRRNEAARGALSRSILLIIAGLLGVGMLTLMLHAPREEQEPRPTR